MRSQSAPRITAIAAANSQMRRGGSLAVDTMPTPPIPHPPLRLKELHPREIADALAYDARLLIPVGTCEQHGPHLPLGCDTIIVEHLADDLSSDLRILRAPTVEYGVNAERESIAPGNATLRRKSLLRALNDLTDTWEAGGVCEFLGQVLDGIEVADLTKSGLGPLHGDEVDTSLLLYLAPELVRMDLAEDYIIAPGSNRRYRRSALRVPSATAGSLGRPSLASAEVGEAIYTRIRGKIRERVLIAPLPDE